MKEVKAGHDGMYYWDDDAYLFAIHSTDMEGFSRIKLEEELSLARARALGTRAQKRLESKARMSASEKQRLLNQVEEGKAAVDKLITSNYRLVLYLAWSCFPVLTENSISDTSNGINLSFPDLVQTGYVGLIEAALRFDHKRGVKFSTYACLIILQHIYNTFSENSGLEHSRKDYVHVLKVQAAISELSENLGRFPTDREISEKSGIGTRTIKNLGPLLRNLQLLSLHSIRVTDDADYEYLYESTPSKAFPPTEEQAIQNVFVEKLRQTIIEEIEALLKKGKLKPEAASVLLYYFGFDNGIPKSLDETAQKFGLKSRQIIHIWLNNAFVHLSKSPQLRLFLESL